MESVKEEIAVVLVDGLVISVMNEELLMEGSSMERLFATTATQEKTANLLVDALMVFASNHRH